MEGVRCFLCANGSPVEPRLHYIQVMATDTAHTTDYCRLSASELKTRVASCDRSARWRVFWRRWG